MMEDLTRELEKRHRLFMDALEEKFNLNVIREDFSNLKKLSAIFEEVKEISDDVSRSNDILISINKKQDVSEKADNKSQQKVNEYIERELQSKEEVRQLRQENEGLKKNINSLNDKIDQLLKEVQRQKELRYEPRERLYTSSYQSEGYTPTVRGGGSMESTQPEGRSLSTSNPYTNASQEEEAETNTTTTQDDSVERPEEVKPKNKFSCFGGLFKK